MGKGKDIENQKNQDQKQRKGPDTGRALLGFEGFNAMVDTGLLGSGALSESDTFTGVAASTIFAATCQIAISLFDFYFKYKTSQVQFWSSYYNNFDTYHKAQKAINDRGFFSLKELESKEEIQLMLMESEITQERVGASYLINTLRLTTYFVKFAAAIMIFTSLEENTFVRTLGIWLIAVCHVASNLINAKLSRQYTQHTPPELKKDGSTGITPTDPTQGPPGPREIRGWELRDVPDDGNCFYYAVADQLSRQAREAGASFLNSSDGVARLRELVADKRGTTPKDKEWATDKDFFPLLEALNDDGFNVMLAIVDTRRPELGFTAYYLNDKNEHITHANTDTQRQAPKGKFIIRLAATGDHFLSVVYHPALTAGVFRKEFNLVKPPHSFFKSSAARRPSSSKSVAKPALDMNASKQSDMPADYIAPGSYKDKSNSEPSSGSSRDSQGSGDSPPRDLRS